ncbi:hypothetical protein RRG08_002304 [Elysia crispata]|uniref:Uncharacterized protein n=1 Tax=Elysia crispata TaxID=231223 RepID=A0AAE1DD51_9GAST|nr:hypothetical protein RRG08_002304 [Elysia crispata]
MPVVSVKDKDSQVPWDSIESVRPTSTQHPGTPPREIRAHTVRPTSLTGGPNRHSVCVSGRTKHPAQVLTAGRVPGYG